MNKKEFVKFLEEESKASVWDVQHPQHAIAWVARQAQSMLDDSSLEIEQEKHNAQDWEDEYMRLKRAHELLDESALETVELLHDSIKEIESLQQQNKAYESIAEFAKEIFRVAFDGGALDGADIQEMGSKYGLLNEEGYSIEKHGEEFLEFADEGDTIYTFSDTLKSLSHIK